jgi:hypothetical protein
MLPLLVEGIYYAVTGIWPLVSIRTFMKVTGPKTDLWLVKTVGLLVLASGSAMLVAYARNTRSPEILTLAIGQAIFFLLIDVIYALKGLIWKTYLIDAAVQIVLIVWIALRW